MINKKQNIIITSLIFIFALMSLALFFYVENYYDKRILYFYYPLITVGLFTFFSSRFIENNVVKTVSVLIMNTFLTYLYLEIHVNSVYPLLFIEANYWYNILIILALYSLLLILTGNIRPAVVIGNVIFAIISVANVVLVELRGRPLYLTDITSIKTAINVSGSYSVVNVHYIGIILFFVLVLIYNIFVCGKHCLSIERITLKSRVKILIPVLIFSIISFGTPLYKNLGVTVNYWFHSNGIALDYVVESREFRVVAPESYSPKQIKEDAKKYVEKSAESNIKPNIICIMNESFSDMSLYGDIKTNKDNLPYVHSIKGQNNKNLKEGFLNCSVYGGNTANTEYEFLTNDTCLIYPSNAVPYQTYLHGKGYISNLSTQLKKYGYKTYAMHPWYSNGWNRPNIYSYMKFDETYFKDDFEGEYIRDYLSDKANYDKIIDIFENKKKDEPLFIFNITMQNHGGYDKADYKGEINTSLSASYSNLDQYLSLAYESDKAIEYLINYFSKVSEPTIICIFGDHQPKIESEFYREMFNRDDDNYTLEENAKMYLSQYVLWKNFGDGFDDFNMVSPSFLSAFILKEAKIPLTPYQNFITNDLAKKYNSISAVYSYDKNNKLIESTKEMNKDFENYRSYIYNHEMDNKEYVAEFFEN